MNAWLDKSVNKKYSGQLIFQSPQKHIFTFIVVFLILMGISGALLPHVSCSSLNNKLCFLVFSLLAWQLGLEYLCLLLHFLFPSSLTAGKALSLGPFSRLAYVPCLTCDYSGLVLTLPKFFRRTSWHKHSDSETMTLINRKKVMMLLPETCTQSCAPSAKNCFGFAVSHFKTHQWAGV